MFLLGTSIMFIIIVLASTMGGRLLIFVDAGSFLFVVVSYIGMIVATNSWQDILTGFKVVLKKDYDKKSIKSSIKTYKMLSKASIYIGLIGFLVGVMSMLQSLSDPSSLGPSVSVSLIVVLYVLVIEMVILLPIKTVLCKSRRNS